MAQYMLGKRVFDKQSYLLLGVFKNGIYHCATYTDNDRDGEKITSIRTGEVFNSIHKFVESVYHRECYHEWSECHYYNEELSEWLPMLYLLPRKQLF
jgi:hypothetical protein